MAVLREYVSAALRSVGVDVGDIAPYGCPDLAPTGIDYILHLFKHVCSICQYRNYMYWRSRVIYVR